MAINYCNQDIKGTLTTTGNITSGGSITMPDYIYHTGDTNTYFGETFMYQALILQIVHSATLMLVLTHG